MLASTGVDHSPAELTLTISSSKGLYLFGEKSQTIPSITSNNNLPFKSIANALGHD
ncbi:MAG: hypothetical protein ACJATQ_001214 [Cellvibrionaceae bacterium]|jgi:hypothetical protein